MGSGKRPANSHRGSRSNADLRICEAPEADFKFVLRHGVSYLSVLIGTVYLLFIAI